jgi:hypothetical protein
MSKVVIATPVYGKVESASVSYGYHSAVCRLLRDPAISFIEGRIFMNVDLVRARSRAVRMFLESPGTHLLFWDCDVVPRDLGVIGAMAASGKDVISLPYPRKRVDWDKVSDYVRDENEQAELGRQSGPELEGHSTDWPIRGTKELPVDGVIRVNECGLGFTMIRREAIEKMIAAHPELYFRDAVDGTVHPTFALFQLIIDPVNRDILSEDYSFCRRWRDLGGEIHMILDPASHVGEHVFGGHLHG